MSYKLCKYGKMNIKAYMAKFYLPFFAINRNLMKYKIIPPLKTVKIFL